MSFVAALHLHNVGPEFNLEWYKPFISLRNQHRLNLFQEPIDAKRSMFGELLASILMWLYIPSRELPSLNHSEYGAPYFPTTPDISVSISHSGDWVLAAINHEKSKIGVDVEKILDFDWREVAQRFHSTDLKVLESLSESRAQIEFYRQWTAKEAWSKTGKGTLIQALQRSFSPPTWSDMEWTSLRLDQEHMCSICRKPELNAKANVIYFLTIHGSPDSNVSQDAFKHQKIHIIISVADFNASVADYTERLGDIPDTFDSGAYALWDTKEVVLLIKCINNNSNTLTDLEWNDVMVFEFTLNLDKENPV